MSEVEVVSSGDLEKLFACSSAMLKKYAASGIAVRVKNGLWDKDASVTNLVIHLRKGASNQSQAKGAKEESLVQGAALKAAQTAIAQQRLRTEAGSLIKRADAMVIFSQLCGLVRMAFMEVSPAIVRELDLTEDAQCDAVERIVREKVNELVARKVAQKNYDALFGADAGEAPSLDPDSDAAEADGGA